MLVYLRGVRTGWTYFHDCLAGFTRIDLSELCVSNLVDKNKKDENEKDLTDPSLYLCFLLFSS